MGVAFGDNARCGTWTLVVFLVGHLVHAQILEIVRSGAGSQEDLGSEKPVR
jgi:hypothetical protein